MDKKWKNGDSVDAQESPQSTKLPKSASALGAASSRSQGAGIAQHDAHRLPKFPMTNPNLMSAARVELMHRVLDGFNSEHSLVFLWHFDRLSACDIFLKWLIANRLTGRTFHEWTLFNKFTPRSCVQFITRHIRPVEN